MKAILKTTGIVIVILVALISVSCGNTPGEDPTALTGTWTITPNTNTGAKTLGSTVMTLTYFGEFVVDIWLGGCVVTGGEIDGTWNAGGASGFGQNSVSIVSNFDTNSGDSEDQIDFTITSALGTTMTGSFEGEPDGDWSGFSGTFTMVKQ